MSRYLIINADDFGMCRSANLAVYDLFEKGGITSATIMAPCPWAKEAAIWAKNHPEYAVGLHLTTTAEWGNYRWTPVAENVPSLKDEEGFMWHESDQFEQHADLEEVRKEICAQYDRLAQFGFTPSHFDNHMGSLYGVATGRFELLSLTIEECAKHGGMPFRFPSKFTDEQFGNEMLDINVPKDVVMSLLEPMIKGANDAGVAILDKDEPWKVIGKTNSYILAPEAVYEQHGNSDNAAFACGAIADYENDKIILYYGGADKCICRADGSLSELVQACIDGI